MREKQDVLDELSLRVVIITFEAGSMARAYVEQTGLPWPLLVDRERSLYEAYGMLKAGFWDLWGPATWIAYGKALLSGQKLQAGGEDVNQRGGDILIDPEGIVRIHHVGKGPADRPEVSRLIQFVREFRSPHR